MHIVVFAGIASVVQCVPYTIIIHSLTLVYYSTTTVPLQYHFSTTICARRSLVVLSGLGCFWCISKGGGPFCILKYYYIHSRTHEKQFGPLEYAYYLGSLITSLELPKYSLDFKNRRGIPKCNINTTPNFISQRGLLFVSKCDIICIY